MRHKELIVFILVALAAMAVMVNTTRQPAEEPVGRPVKVWIEHRATSNQIREVYEKVEAYYRGTNTEVMNKTEPMPGVWSNTVMWYKF